MSGTGAAETILVVEDEDGVRHLTRDVLELAGYTVLLACSGEEALELLRLHDGAVDLMLTDVVLPGIGGRELAERGASLRPDMKVLYTSGYNEDGALREGVLANVLQFIAKPYSLPDLRRKVREVLDT